MAAAKAMAGITKRGPQGPPAQTHRSLAEHLWDGHTHVGHTSMWAGLGTCVWDTCGVGTSVWGRHVGYAHVCGLGTCGVGTHVWV